MTFGSRWRGGLATITKDPDSFVSSRLNLASGGFLLEHKSQRSLLEVFKRFSKDSFPTRSLPGTFESGEPPMEPPGNPERSSQIFRDTVLTSKITLYAYLITRSFHLLLLVIDRAREPFLLDSRAHRDLRLEIVWLTSKRTNHTVFWIHGYKMFSQHLGSSFHPPPRDSQEMMRMRDMGPFSLGSRCSRGLRNTLQFIVSRVAALFPLPLHNISTFQIYGCVWKIPTDFSTELDIQESQYHRLTGMFSIFPK